MAELAEAVERARFDGCGQDLRLWACRAEALLPYDPTDEPERQLHVSRTLSDRREISGSLDPESGDVLDTALRLAATPDADDAARSAATRRADALVDILPVLPEQSQRRGWRS